MLLPALILGTEVKRTRVLKVWRKDDGLVPGFAGKLHTEVPGVESHEDKVEVLRGQVFVGKRVKPVDRIPKGSGISNVFPSQRRQAR